MRLDATARVRRRAHRRRAENTLHRMRAPPRPARGDSRRQRRNQSFQFSRAFGRASHLDASRVARIALLANMTIRCVQTEKRKYSRCFFAVWVSSERARQRQSNVEEYRRERDIVRGSPWTGLIGRTWSLLVDLSSSGYIHTSYRVHTPRRVVFTRARFGVTDARASGVRAPIAAHTIAGASSVHARARVWRARDVARRRGWESYAAWCWSAHRHVASDRAAHRAWDAR